MFYIVFIDMKVIINESDLKKVFNRLGVDLEGNVHMVTNQYELPMVFDNLIPPTLVRMYLNNYGPMYVINLPPQKYLFQRQKNVRDYVLIDRHGNGFTQSEFLEDKLKIPPIGITLQDVIDTFVQEEE